MEPSASLYGLFLSALLSSTLLPGGSEALLLWLQQQGVHSSITLLWTASAGNTLGGLSTWWIGRLIAQHWGEKLQHKIDPRAAKWIEKHGSPALLLSWLPVVGDGLCLAAGWFQIRFFPALLLIAIGKIARYSALLWIAS